MSLKKKRESNIGDTEAGGNKPCENKGRDQNDPSASQGTSRLTGVARNGKMQGWILYHRYQRQHGPADTCILLDMHSLIFTLIYELCIYKTLFSYFT